ncbi:MAG: hypothetical protein AUH15_03025 [Acidobacteriales bacterium 13_2_20CM_55_8]|nr:MAG: hypothetical protein AUH15_03025 [Acidobacteriales bacterium 13_2_20CM_55_8]
MLPRNGLVVEVCPGTRIVVDEVEFASDAAGGGCPGMSVCGLRLVGMRSTRTTAHAQPAGAAKFESGLFKLLPRSFSLFYCG